ncbi:hypothetical protein HYS97_01240 [Candidatus Daviesbacteria bacterium]|nr:hypothetical protein [Candidatus Daviesbacteria bacterium]
MPKFFKQDVFDVGIKKEPILDPEHELPSSLDTPELPPPPLDWRDLLLDEDTLYNSVQTLLSWKAPSRPFRKKNRSYYTTILILILLISLIAFLMGEKLLIGVLLALLFVVYVLNFVAPEEIDYKISTQGITIGEHFYHWWELDSFWFSEKEGFKVLNVLTKIRFPGLLIIVLGNASQEEVKRVCARYLPFHEIAPKSQLEKWAESLQKHFPLENPQR